MQTSVKYPTHMQLSHFVRRCGTITKYAMHRKGTPVDSLIVIEMFLCLKYSENRIQILKISDFSPSKFSETIIRH